MVKLHDHIDDQINTNLQKKNKSRFDTNKKIHRVEGVSSIKISNKQSTKKYHEKICKRPFISAFHDDNNFNIETSLKHTNREEINKSRVHITIKFSEHTKKLMRIVEKFDVELTGINYNRPDAILTDANYIQAYLIEHQSQINLNEITDNEYEWESKVLANEIQVPLVDFDIFASNSPEARNFNLLKTHSRSAIFDGKSKLQENINDSEGYYNFSVGEIMDGRYEVYSAYGRGVFSTVLRAKDITYFQQAQIINTQTEVAIKVIRENEKMCCAAKLERVLLSKLALTSSDYKHVITLVGHFEYNSHFCLTFEPMDMNLRTCIKKFGRNVGINLHAVRNYTVLMLLSLKHLKKNGILHADIKPDNILVDKNRKVVKICDLGSAMLAEDIEITPYLVSRFYRPPEVILGLPYDSSMDLWSVGCVIFELFIGRILFPGKTNNDMVKQIMDVKGPIPKKILRKGAFTERHFDLSIPSTPFCYVDIDNASKKKIRTILYSSAVKNFSDLIRKHDVDKSKTAKLADLLERMMIIDPEKRISLNQALKHPFCDEG
jgi:serine/threonine-protein kinase PRP4